MVGIIFQAWFILFISLYLYFNDAQPNLVKELSANTLLVSVLFLFWQKKKLKVSIPIFSSSLLLV